jgi:hypothetical protein
MRDIESEGISLPATSCTSRERPQTAAASTVITATVITQRDITKTKAAAAMVRPSHNLPRFWDIVCEVIG